MKNRRAAPMVKKPISIAGLELGGGKSARTALVLVHYYSDQNKIFLADHLPHLMATQDRYSDEVVLDTIQGLKPSVLGTNAPLSYPPCLVCETAKCPGIRSCKVPAVRWMHEEAMRVGIPTLKHPTPYTQRPVDVLLRTRIQPRIALDLHIEESMGASRAPLASRMQYLRTRFQRVQCLEVLPRLALAMIADWYGISQRELRRYTLPEEGATYRMSILDKLESEVNKNSIPQLFLYESDKVQLAKELPSFNALMSAFMGVFSKAGFLQKPPTGFNLAWGFVAIPSLSLTK